MRTLPLLFGLVACFESDLPASSSPSTSSTSTGSTETDTETATTTPTATSSFGTQVGSEGFWGCTITAVTPIPRDELPPGFDRTAMEVAEELLGSWVVALDLGEGAQEGDLHMVSDQAAWVETEGDCGPYLLLGVGAELSLPALPPIPLEGLLGARVDDAALALASPADADAVQAVVGEPPFAGAFLRIDAVVDVEALVGDVGWADCPRGTCATWEALGAVDGVR